MAGMILLQRALENFRLSAQAHAARSGRPTRHRLSEGLRDRARNARSAPRRGGESLKEVWLSGSCPRRREPDAGGLRARPLVPSATTGTPRASQKWKTSSCSSGSSSPIITTSPRMVRSRIHLASAPTFGLPRSTEKSPTVRELKSSFADLERFLQLNVQMQRQHTVPRFQIRAGILGKDPDLLHGLRRATPAERFRPVRCDQHQRPRLVKSFDHRWQKLRHRRPARHHDGTGLPRFHRPTQCEKSRRPFLKMAPDPHLSRSFHLRKHLQQNRIPRTPADHELADAGFHGALQNLHCRFPTSHAQALA